MAKRNCIFCNKEVGLLGRSLTKDKEAVCNKCKKDYLISVFKVEDHTAEQVKIHREQVVEGSIIWDFYLNRKNKLKRKYLAENAFFDGQNGLMLYVDKYKWRKKGLKACAYKISNIKRIIVKSVDLAAYSEGPGSVYRHDLILKNKYNQEIFMPLLIDVPRAFIELFSKELYKKVSSSEDDLFIHGDTISDGVCSNDQNDEWNIKTNTVLKKLYYGDNYKNPIKYCYTCKSVLRINSKICPFCCYNSFLYKNVKQDKPDDFYKMYNCSSCSESFFIPADQKIDICPYCQKRLL